MRQVYRPIGVRELLSSDAFIVLLITAVLPACSGGEPAGRNNATFRDAGSIRFDPHGASGGGSNDALSTSFDDSGVGQQGTDTGVGQQSTDADIDPDGAARIVDAGAMDSRIVDAGSPPPDPVVIDFIAEAPHAGWHNNDGAVVWPLARGDERGSCTFDDATLEDGSQQHILFTHPKWVENGFMHAAYTVTVPPASEKPRVEATFGFLGGADRCTNGMTFAVSVKINDKWQYLISATKMPTGALMSASADLSASWLAGQTLVFVISADAGADAGCDWGAWTKARITRSTT